MRKGLFLLFFILLALNFTSVITPPRALKIPRVDTLFNEIKVDDYYWLRNRNDPRVVKYLEAENDYTQKVMAHTISLQKILYKEMLARIEETDTTVPVKKKDYYYYTRTEKGKEYPIYCRKYKTLNNIEEVILDQNRLGAEKNYCDIGAIQVSPNNRYLAYTVDSSGQMTTKQYFILHSTAHSDRTEYSDTASSIHQRLTSSSILNSIQHSISTYPRPRMSNIYCWNRAPIPQPKSLFWPQTIPSADSK